MNEQGWRQILDQETQARALKVVDEVACEIATSCLNLGNPSLGGGMASLAIFFHYLDLAIPGRGYADLSIDCLNQAVDLAGRSKASLSLHEGVVGVAWAIEHIQREGSQEDDPNEEIDPALVEHLGRTPWNDTYDLIGGLVGIGVYALERMPRPIARACLQRIVDRLEELRHPEARGLIWHTPLSLLSEEQRKMTPEGYSDLGLAHGVPGIIGFLGKAQIFGIDTRGLLRRAVEWVLAQELPNSEFSCWIVPGMARSRCRSAWCYGPPGIAASLLLAARAAGNREWEERAIAIARADISRSPAQSMVSDAGICHGACGLGHIYNRFYQATGEEPFAQAARYWFQQTFEMRRPGQGVGGFLANYLDGPRPQPGLLTGSAGIALTLLAAATDIEPAWDRALLLS